MKSRCIKQYLYTEDQIAFLFTYLIVPADIFLSGFMFSNYKGNDRLNLVNQLIVLITKTTVSLMNNLSAFFYSKKGVKPLSKQRSWTYWNTKGCNSNRTLSNGDYIKSSTRNTVTVSFWPKKQCGLTMSPSREYIYL